MFTLFPSNLSIPQKGDIPKRIKFGIDPTAPNLHLGHLVPLLLLKRFKEDGHIIDIILGTFTAQMGDPSGKEKTRPILSEDEVNKNADIICDQLSKILGKDINIHRNSEWFNKMDIPSLFSLISKFNLSNLLSRDAFQLRLKNGNSIGMHELLVPILQALDSVILKSEIEIGGLDQLFNFQITRNVQEIKGQIPETCIMTPIIKGTDGRKMSKSLNNCIFLNECSESIFGKCMSVDDNTMDEWIPLLTNIKENILSPMERKKQMAFSIVEHINGKEEAEKSLINFEKTIQNKENPINIEAIEASDVIEAITKIRKCSKSEARRLIQNGSTQVNGNKIISNTLTIPGQIIKIGKRHFGRIIG